MGWQEIICPGWIPGRGARSKERSNQEKAVHQVYKNRSLTWWRTMWRIIDGGWRLTGTGRKCVKSRQKSDEFFLLCVRSNEICDFLGFVGLYDPLFILTATHSLCWFLHPAAMTGAGFPRWKTKTDRFTHAIMQIYRGLAGARYIQNSQCEKEKFFHYDAPWR